MPVGAAAAPPAGVEPKRLDVVPVALPVVAAAGVDPNAPPPGTAAGAAPVAGAVAAALVPIAAPKSPPEAG